MRLARRRSTHVVSLGLALLALMGWIASQVPNIASPVANASSARSAAPMFFAPIADEPFAYPVGELIGQNGGTGWAGPWGGQTANTEVVSPAPLTFAVPGGGIVDGGSTALQVSGNNDNVAFRQLAVAQNGDDVFVSFLIRFIGPVDNNDFIVWWFDNVTTGDHSTVPNIGIKANREDGSGPEDFVARVDLNSNVYSTDISASPDGTTFFVVGRLFKSVPGPANNYDRFSLWVNPAFGDEATPDVTSSATGTISSFTHVGIRSVNLDADNAVLIDELCLGTTWEDCVPDCVITCPSNITVSNDPNQCGAVVNYPAPIADTECGTITCSPASGSFFPVGTTTVTCNTTAGASCSFTVTVNDTQPPSIDCPDNVIAVTTAPGQTGSVVTFPPPTASDNCPGVTTACTPPSGSTFPVGTTTVTCTATDASGNTASCSFAVQIFDVCLQDNVSPSKVLLFNSFTGDYIFCCGNVTLSGRGIVTKQAGNISLQHTAPDRRVMGKISVPSKSGNASLQFPAGNTLCTISDFDIRNNTCTCTPVMNGV